MKAWPKRHANAVAEIRLAHRQDIRRKRSIVNGPMNESEQVDG